MKAEHQGMSARRRQLVDKLKVVTKTVAQNLTPVHITELWAYGSFIRPKEDPGDIDLAVFYTPEPVLDKKLRDVELLLHEVLPEHKSMWDTVWKEAFEGKVDTLVSILEHIIGPDERYRLWVEACRAGWVQRSRSYGYSNMSLDPYLITKRVLLGTQRSLHLDPDAFKPITEKEKKLVEKPHVLLWSEAARNVDANVALIETQATAAAAKELPRFREQFDRQDAEYSLIRGGVAYLLEQQKAGRDLTIVDPSEVFEITRYGGFKEKTHSIMEAGMLRAARQMGIKEAFAEAIITKHPRSYADELPDGTAREPPKATEMDVEALRAANKALTHKLPFAHMVKLWLTDMERSGAVSPKDSVAGAVFKAYLDTPVAMASDELRAEVLKELGLGHVKIKIVSTNGPTGDRYRLRD